MKHPTLIEHQSPLAVFSDNRVRIRRGNSQSMTQKVLSLRIKDALLKAKNLIFDKTTASNERETAAQSEDLRVLGVGGEYEQD